MAPLPHWAALDASSTAALPQSSPWSKVSASVSQQNRFVWEGECAEGRVQLHPPPAHTLQFPLPSASRNSLWPLFSPRPRPARSRAWSSVRAVRTPKTTGVPVSSWTRMRPWLTASQMYSKCMVEPLMSTPTAMTASNSRTAAAVDDDSGPGVPVRAGSSTSERRLAVAPPRSEGAALAAWALPPAMSLETVSEVRS